MHRSKFVVPASVALALVAMGLFATPAVAATPHVPVGTNPTCPVDEQTGAVVTSSVHDPCWVEYVSIDGVWIPALLIPPTDGTTGGSHPLPGTRVPSTKGLIWVHGGFDRSAADGLAEYCGSSWSAAGGWDCGSGSSSCDECPRWERMFQLAGLRYWILAPDYRDSGSHGSADVSQNAFDDLAGKDVDDVGLGADFLRDSVNVDSLVLFGTSRGGWLAAGATYRYDDELDGVAVISGGCDWISVYPDLSDGERSAVQQAFGGPPNGANSPPAYFERSACHNFSEMDKPILLMHGTTDASFPIGQARMFRDGLLGTAGHPPLEYHEYDAGHTFFWGDNTEFGAEHWADFNDWVESILGTNTVITDGPPAYTQLTTVSFSFDDTAGSTTFRCRLDGGSWDYSPSCTSPRQFTSADGETHTFEVAAQFGTVWDPTPAERTWTTDLTPPATSITSGPASPTTQSKVHFTLASNEPFPTYRCELDGTAIPNCVSSTEYTGITQGSHSFKAWASDAAGNEDDTPAVFTWVMDTGPPKVTIDSGPSGTVTSTDATFTFSANETITAWECRISQTENAGTYSPCSSPRQYLGLAQGTWYFTVKATDAAGNTGTKQREWTIELPVVPETSFTQVPAAYSSQTSFTFKFASSPTGWPFECKLDAASFGACSGSTQHQVSGLTEGSHTFQVRAMGSGGPDPSPATHTWTVDLTDPDTTITGGPSGSTNQTSPSFTFTSNESGATFECKLDGSTWAGCTSPKNYSGLSASQHTFQVRATDLAGRTDPTQATRTWTIDLTAPDTSITGGPAAGSTTSSNAATFTFTSPDATATFECSLDGSAFAACTSGVAYTGLSDASHIFQVRARDPAGNLDASPATRAWTVDAGPPDTAITGGPSGTVTSTDASFTFTSTDSGTFECRLDGSAWASCTSPKAYSGLSFASHTFEVRAKDAANNVDPTPASRTWTIQSGPDTDPPETTIDSGPSGTVATGDASFTFSSDEGGSTFECRLDGGGWAGCTSPKGYSGLGNGSHTFEVRATDPAGNLDTTPASRTWTVSTGGPDTTPPETTIVSGPADPSPMPATFAFDSSEAGSTFKCRLYRNPLLPWTACTSPHTFTSLPEGDYRFEVRATDAAGNADLSPAFWEWGVGAADTDPPETSIDSGPSGTVATGDASFTFSSDENGSTFECRLDGGAWAGCASPKPYSGLGDGSHTFEVRAADPAGNIDASPASRTWTVSTGGGDSDPPETTITAGPADRSKTTSTDAAFEFVSDEVDSTFECRVDGGAWTVCVSPVALSGLSLGSHTFEVRAIDPVGNTDPTPVARLWKVIVAKTTGQGFAQQR